MSKAPSRIVFGLVVPATGTGIGDKVDRFVAALEKRIAIPVERRDAASYEALANDVREGKIDLAWLPPIVFVRLGEIVQAIGSVLRGGAAAYEAVLIVPQSSKIQTLDALRGTRAGWVDRWSAAGFVLPRVNLAVLGIDPRTLFRTETFHGSHQSVTKALLSGACDVAGTYAHADGEGRVVSGPWDEIEGAEIRVLAMFGAIPPDVIAVRSELADAITTPVFEALRDLCLADMSLIEDIFGGQELKEGLAPGYDSLKTALQMASSRGIFGEP